MKFIFSQFKQLQNLWIINRHTILKLVVGPIVYRNGIHFSGVLYISRTFIEPRSKG
jgi:hypothetical protein